MSFILSGLTLIACENADEQAYEAPKKISVIEIFACKEVKLFSFTVQAKQWKRLSGVDRFAEIGISAITSSVIESGSVILYLNESGKDVSLPFTFYQSRRAMSFRPSYKEGRVYINILGNFIVNVHDQYTFKALVVDSFGLKKFRKVNWYNYEEVKRYVLKKSEL